MSTATFCSLWVTATLSEKKLSAPVVLLSNFMWSCCVCWLMHVQWRRGDCSTACHAKQSDSLSVNIVRSTSTSLAKLWLMVLKFICAGGHKLSPVNSYLQKCAESDSCLRRTILVKLAGWQINCDRLSWSIQCGSHTQCSTLQCECTTAAIFLSCKTLPDTYTL